MLAGHMRAGHMRNLAAAVRGWQSNMLHEHVRFINGLYCLLNGFNGVSWVVGWEVECTSRTLQKQVSGNQF